MRVCNDYIWTSANMSGSLNSDPFPLDQVYMASVQLSWGGTPSGTFSIQVSNDPGVRFNNNSVSGVTNWTTYDGSSSSVTGVSGTLAYNIANLAYRWMRVVWTRSSGGTASLTGIINSKGV